MEGWASLEISPPGGYVGPMSHATDPALLARLRRAEGHLRAIVTMVQEGPGDQTAEGSLAKELKTLARYL